MIFFVIVCAQGRSFADWSFMYPGDAQTLVDPVTTLYAEGMGPENEEFGLFLRKDGQAWRDWGVQVNHNGLWVRDPLGSAPYPVADYLLYISYEDNTVASIELEIVEGM